MAGKKKLGIQKDFVPGALQDPARFQWDQICQPPNTPFSQKDCFEPKAAEKKQTQEELSGLLICLKAGCIAKFPL